MDRGYLMRDHTADMAIELWAPSELDLLVQGARAVVDLLTRGASVHGADTREVQLSCVDAEDRLVCWLNEVLWLALSEGFLAHDARISLGERELRATVIGEAGAREKIASEIKSVTYHDLWLEHASDGWRARVVIDV
jgi:SHS2 domain-containing protein